MDQKQMFYAALKRPLNFEELSPEQQWEIDKQLGILDWDGPKDMTESIQYQTRSGRLSGKQNTRRPETQGNCRS